MALHETQTDFYPTSPTCAVRSTAGAVMACAPLRSCLRRQQEVPSQPPPSRLIKFPESAFYQSDRQRFDRTSQAADAISVSLSEEPGTAVTIRNFLAVRNYDAIKVSHLRYTRYL